MKGRRLSYAALMRVSANEIERLYDDALATKQDVIAWVRESAKKAGRIYVPDFARYRLRLRRREDLEDKLFARKAGYWKDRRDRRRSRRRR